MIKKPDDTTTLQKALDSFGISLVCDAEPLCAGTGSSSQFLDLGPATVVDRLLSGWIPGLETDLGSTVLHPATVVELKKIEYVW